jgi:DNA-binding NtrC family response regulator
MAASAKPPKAQADKVPTIVIVDDDTDVLLALSDALGAAIPEAQIFPAESAEAALDFIRGHHADLVISDYRMPRLSGVELADILKQTRKPPATILMTGHPSTGLAYRALNEHDFAAIFAKPFDPAVMAATAIRILSKAMGYRPSAGGARLGPADEHVRVGDRQAP